MALHENDYRRPTRFRRAVVAAGVGVTLALSGCDIAPSVQDYLNSCESLTSYEASGAVIIYRTTELGQNLNDAQFIGHGGIYKKDNSLWLATVNHVSSVVGKDEFLTAVICGKEGRVYRRDISTTQVSSTFSEKVEIIKDVFDSIVAYPLPMLNDDFSRAIASGAISSLTPRTVDTIKEGQALGLVDSTGHITELSYVVGEDVKKYPKILNGGEACRGQSGSSILVLDANKKPTGEAVGQLQSMGDQDTAIFDDCGDNFLGFIPFNFASNT